MNEINKILTDLFAKGIVWTDQEDMDEARSRTYKADAEMILATEVWRNEYNRLFESILHNTAMSSVDFNEVQRARTALLVLERFKRNIEQALEPKSTEPANKPHHAI